MSDLIDIRDKLQDTVGIIAQVKRQVVSFPDDKSVRLNLASLEKRQAQLEALFAEAAADVGADVCRYRFLPENGNVKVASLANALVDYQLLVSVLYEAVTTATPRQTLKLSAETVAKTAFDFGYSFAGSVGFALTIPNRRLIGMETDLDQAFQMIAGLAKATNSVAIKDYARRVGRAPIRAIYRWADDHVKGQVNADVEWRRGERVQGRFLVQIPELKALTHAIDETSDEERFELVTTGMLQGADVPKKTFHFDTDDGVTIRGTFSYTIDPSRTVELPKRYRAKISGRRIIFYSTEEERVSYELTSLEPL